MVTWPSRPRRSSSAASEFATLETSARPRNAAATAMVWNLPGTNMCGTLGAKRQLGVEREDERVNRSHECPNRSRRDDIHVAHRLGKEGPTGIAELARHRRGVGSGGASGEYV